MGGAAMIPMALQMGAKLFGGTGGGQAQAAPAPQQPGPFDMLANANKPPAPAPQPPMPQPGAAPVPGRNPMFSGNIDEAELPTRNPLFSGGIEDESRMDQGGPGQTMTKSKQPPMILPDGGLNPAMGQRSGMSTDTIYATDVTGQGAPSRAKSMPVEEARTQSLFGEEDPDAAAPVQAATFDSKPAAPKQSTVFDFSEDPKNPKSLSRIDFDTDGEEDEDRTSTGEGLFGADVGDALGNFQDKLGDSPTNPLFQMGMGLLSSGYDGSNPYKQINASLGQIPGLQIASQGADLAERAGARADKKAGQEDEDAALMALVRDLLMKQGKPQPAGGNIARGAAKVIR